MTSTSYADGRVTLFHGDCLDVLAQLPDASVDSVVTDPPYGIAFMGKAWDQPGQYGSERRNGTPQALTREGDAMGAGRYDLSPSAMRNFQRWCEAWASECLRVLKPGGHLVAFGGARTWHRLAGGIEDAGFEIRDSMAWLFGSGFPKSLDVAKAIDIAAGATREPVTVPGASHRTATSLRGAEAGGARGMVTSPEGVRTSSTAVTEAARAWEGWGTALKPGFEPIVVARKPLAGTVAANVLAHGTGALHIDACRVGQESTRRTKRGGPGDFPHEDDAWAPRAVEVGSDAGRWPANVVLDEDQAAALDEQSGVLSSGTMRAGAARQPRPGGEVFGSDGRTFNPADTYGDSGGASRFFYVAKADQNERVRVNGIAHPTVKPLALMRWLVRLVTPPGGTVLEPFAGSGTTVEACILEGFRCTAIEREDDYLPLIEQRIHRRIDPVAAVRGSGEDGGLFDLFDEVTS